MATATKKKPTEAPAPALPGTPPAPTYTPEQIAEFKAMGAKSPLFHQGKTNADGTPWKHAEKKKSGEEMVAIYTEKLARVKERHEKQVAQIEKMIAYHSGARSNPGAKIDPVKAQEAAAGLLAQGYTQEQILEMAANLRLAAAGVKGKSAEEIAALQAAKPAVSGVEESDEAEDAE